MRIAHNLSALNTTRLLDSTTRKHLSITEKLSSGYKINRAGDNAASLNISEKMRAQIRGLDQASKNAQNGISLIETADGALNEVHNIIQRMRELSVQAANGTSTEEDKSMIQNEISQLTSEINRIASDTEFNNIKLLDGSLSNTESNNISLNELLARESDGLNIIYVENDYSTQQSGYGNKTDTASRYNALKNLLKTEVVPQAVSKIMQTYSSAFGYLSSSSVGIGLKLYNDSSSGVLASVGAGVGSNPKNPLMVYQLAVNTAKVLDSNGNIKDREELEAIVAHEFVHAFMDEALTCGMFGFNSDGSNNKGNTFPLWFIEGMAQTASGGYANFNDFVNRGMGITKNSSISDISNAVKSNNYKLSTNSGAAAYGTGYLACMYLGYLASGASDISEKSITKGLDSILTDMISGKSFNTVIKERTNNKYSSVSDFQNKFGDKDSCNFIKQLTERVGEGNGSLVAGNYNTDDVLPDGKVSISLFQLDIENEDVMNIYPDDVEVFSGGGTSSNGSKPIEGYGNGELSGPGEVKPPVVELPVEPEKPVASGSKIDLSNIKSIDGIEYDRSSNTLTVTKDGDYTLSGNNTLGTRVIIKDGVTANITLDNAKINTSSGEGIKLEGNSNLTLKLAGNSNITSTVVGKAAVGVTEGAVLNVEGDGKLTVKSADLAAGIGGGVSESAGTINIKSGEIEATAGTGGAGIGGGAQGTGGNINITGGTIKSTGGNGAAGIGGGLSAEGGNINIDGESAVVTAISGGSGAENIGSGAGVSSSSGNISIDKGVISDGTNWHAHGKVVIKTTIKVSGTFTGEGGSKITISNGGSISGSGTIKVESGSTIKVETGGSISEGTTINNKGNIDNHGTIGSSFTSDSINRVKNYVNKIINELDKKFKLNIGESLQSALFTPKIKVSCNGVTKELQSSSSEIYDASGNKVTNPADVTVNKGDRFTYKVTFKLDKSSNEYFDKNTVISNNIQSSYSELGKAMEYNQLLNSKVSEDGKSITYTYALEADGASGESSGGNTGSDVGNGKLILQIGSNSNQAIGISIDGVSSRSLGINGISVTTASDAQEAIDSCDEALKKVSSTRSNLGAYQNRLEHTISNLDNSSENLQQSESRIRDLDMAKGMVEYSKYQILSQVEQAMLSQANQMADGVLNLLRA